MCGFVRLLIYFGANPHAHIVKQATLSFGDHDYKKDGDNEDLERYKYIGRGYPNGSMF